jgi:hypothetical protein
MARRRSNGVRIKKIADIRVKIRIQKAHWASVKRGQVNRHDRSYVSETGLVKNSSTICQIYTNVNSVCRMSNIVGKCEKDDTEVAKRQRLKYFASSLFARP